ncbi:MAG: carboxypeptidase-like regulatory domain-containing protein [Syntrophobacter sp.]
MSKKKPVCFSRLHVVCSLLIIVPALLAFVPGQNAGACDGQMEQEIGFMLQAPIDSTSCPTITMLGLSIDTTNAIFSGGHHRSLYCDALTAGQVLRVTFASDTLSSGQLSATSVTLPGKSDQDQGNVLVSGPIQASPAPTTTSVSILGLPITLGPATILQSTDDEPLTPESLAALTPIQLAEGQFANVASSSTTAPLTADSLFLHLRETKVVAPLDSSFTCPNISVLGQTIDTSSALFEARDGSTLACTDLQPGQLVKVTLQDQTGPPLLATEVELGKSCGFRKDERVVKVTAPLNSISISALPYTVSVLGSTGVITVDISEAVLVGEDWRPIALGDLMVGQFVEMLLSSNVPATTGVPFTAYFLRSMAPGTVVDFHVFDRHGHRVKDGSNDVRAAVTFTRPGKGASRTVALHTTSNGKFSVANMPKGQAKVVVTRVNSGAKSKAANTVKVARKTTQKFRITLNR